MPLVVHGGKVVAMHVKGFLAVELAGESWQY